MSGDGDGDEQASNPNAHPEHQPAPAGAKRKRSLPGTPDPEAEVVALSPRTLTTASTYSCEVCGKDFRRDQNLQIHRRGHNLPWNRQHDSPAPRKRVYVCPEETCVYHDPSRALGDLTGIKKHYSRKHGEKKWKCEQCSRCYAVRTDWNAHTRLCGAREYECVCCGTLFSRKDSLIIHRATCTESEGNDQVSSSLVGFKANTVNRELLFPSLWGQATSSQAEHKDEQRTGASNQ